VTATRDAGDAPPEAEPVAPQTMPVGRLRAPWVLRAAALAGLVAVICGIALPFAPVVVSTPAVTWPRDPARVESTLLPLTAQRPLGLEVRFGCDAVRRAAAVPDTGDGRGGGIVLATALPGSGQAAAALMITAVADRVQVRVRDTVVVDEPVPVGACTYRLVGTDDGLPVDVRGPPTPLGGIDPAVPIERVPSDPAAVAGPASARVVVDRDGVEVGRWQAERLPDVDLLLSSLTTDAGGLAVALRVDDESTTSPTSVKRVLAVVLGLALLATLVLLVVADRAVRRAVTASPRRVGPAVLVDLLVVGVLALWTFVAPATDDDGYFSLQARNAALTGSVGDYVQFQNRSFTPFTWPYQALAEWQQWAGAAPVLQRVPAAVCGLLTWVAVRALVHSVARRHTLGRAAAAVAFLAWWLPYDMGVRPEPVVALCAAATAALLLHAATTQRLALGWLAVAVAGAGAVAHTAGVVLLGVLVAGLPLLVPLLSDVPGGGDGGGAAGDGTARVHVRPVVLRAVAVGSALCMALLLGFADGGLRDFLRGQAVTGAVFTADGWADEVGRYAFLLDPIPMGNFARRAAVLTCLLALAWFALATVAARARRVAVPVPLVLTASATALGFAALGLTPSKWTHHFGSLAGIGAAFLGLLLVTAVPLTRDALRGGRLPPVVPIALAGSVAAVCALVWHGPNSWPYAWLDGVTAAYVRPSLAGLTLDHPLLWLALLAVAALIVRRVARPPDVGQAVVRGVAVVVAGSLAASAAVAAGVFTVAGLRGSPPGSLWVQNLADPTGCGADVHVLDVVRATTLVPITGPDTTEGFAAGGGFFPGDRPPPGPVWGSLTDRPGGSATTAWYALPTGSDGTPVVVAAGNLVAGSGTVLTVVYGRRGGGGVAETARLPLVDDASSPHWRTFPLQPPAGADAVRIEAVDATGAPHGWVAFTAPALARPVSLAALLPSAVPVAVGWQVAFAHPCVRPPAAVDGVTEPASYAITRTAEPADPPLDGLNDMAWQADRGGVYVHVPRTQSVLALPTVAPVDPYLRVYAFTSPLARAAYVLVPGGRTVSGADAAVWAGS
jgi:hypothetical protein